MVVLVVSSPKRHTPSWEVLAFLSESSRRVIMTGRNLRCGSDVFWRKEIFRRTQSIRYRMARKPVNKRKKSVLMSLTSGGVVGCWAVEISASHEGKVRH